MLREFTCANPICGIKMQDFELVSTGNVSAARCHFRTIGMGTINYRKAAKRLADEAFSTGLFETSLGLDETYLRLNSKEFWNNHKKILKARVPGFGWWIWKSEFVRLCLSEIPDGDLLFYMDAGSYIGKNSTDIEEISKFIQLAAHAGLVGSNSQTFLEKAYSSRLVLDHLGLSEELRNQNQYYAGFLIIQKQYLTLDFVNQWSHLTCKEGHKFLFPPLNTKEDLGFVHHMYDQAILSPLMKLFGAKAVEVGDGSKSGSIRMTRHRYAFSAQSRNTTEIFLFRLISYLSKIRLAAERRIFRNSLHIKPNPHS